MGNPDEIDRTAEEDEARDHGFDSHEEYLDARQEADADRKYHLQKEADLDRWEARMNRI